MLARCVMFHRQFPDKWIDRHTLSKVMRNAGLKKEISESEMLQPKTSSALKSTGSDFITWCQAELVVEKKISLSVSWWVRVQSKSICIVDGLVEFKYKYWSRRSELISTVPSSLRSCLLLSRSSCNKASWFQFWYWEIHRFSRGFEWCFEWGASSRSRWQRFNSQISSREQVERAEAN